MIDKNLESLNFIIQNKSIKTVFQPIISLHNGVVLGHEALSRITADTEIKNPEILFTVAGQYNKLWELELLCRTTALETAFKFMIPPYNKKLFLNVNPNTMHDDNFKKGFTKDFLLEYNIAAHNVIFEITERNVITDISGFKATIEHYKEQDYKIAIDDAGAGYSGLNLISDVNPNYIKLDMQLIRGIDKDSLKYALVKGMVELSKVSNIQLIAEGIETYDEMVTLINLGVQYGQGYYIQKPVSEVLEISKDIIDAIEELNLMRNMITQSDITSTTIRNLCTPTVTVDHNELVGNLYVFFKNNLDCFGVCVLKNDIPVGIITSEKLAIKLSGQYGFTLYQNKPVSQIMDKTFLSVDYKTPVNIVSSMAMARQNDKLYDFIVVTEDDRYLGTVTIKDLLEKVFEIRISLAKHQNPLSGLPGNLIIEQNLTSCIADKEPFSTAYFDIDNFKAYNDIYGFENGDLIIKLLADLLRNSIPEDQFVGHIGGDDFVAILDKAVSESYFDNLVREFETKALDFYNGNDVENGYVLTNNRQGDMQKFPLISLTAVVINSVEHNFSNVYELTKHLALLKSNKKAGRKNDKLKMLG